MKIVLPLFSRLTGKKILFPRVHIQSISPPWRDFYGRLSGGKILQEANIKNGWHKLVKKNQILILSFYVWWEFYIY